MKQWNELVSTQVKNRSITKKLVGSNPSPVWRVGTWIQICASSNYHKKMKAEHSRLVPRELAANVALLTMKWQTTFNEPYFSSLSLLHWQLSELLAPGWCAYAWILYRRLLDMMYLMLRKKMFTMMTRKWTTWMNSVPTLSKFMNYGERLLMIKMDWNFAIIVSGSAVILFTIAVIIIIKYVFLEVEKR